MKSFYNKNNFIDGIVLLVVQNVSEPFSQRISVNKRFCVDSLAFTKEIFEGNHHNLSSDERITLKTQ